MDTKEPNIIFDANLDTLSTSIESNNGGAHEINKSKQKFTKTSPDPISYVTKERVTRPTPPLPSINPMQFVQVKPCNLYQMAQEQLKKAEEAKKLKEVKKEEPEEWQNNLDNWKSSRRKRVEHIIDRVVEAKKLELEELDRTRRKSKTFTKMMEERAERCGSGVRGKLASLAVYNDDESNDLSDLGISNDSLIANVNLSDKSTMLDKAFETAASDCDPESCGYTYEGAIQDYKQRVQRASSNSKLLADADNNNETAILHTPHRGNKICEYLTGFEATSHSDLLHRVEKQKVDVPKVDISKRKKVFEHIVGDLKSGINNSAHKNCLRNPNNSTFETPASTKIRTSDTLMPESLGEKKERLTERLPILDTAVAPDVQQKKPPLIALIDARQLEIMRGEEELFRQKHGDNRFKNLPTISVEGTLANDSGIQEESQEFPIRTEPEQQLNAAITALDLEESHLQEAAQAVNQMEAEFAELTELKPAPFLTECAAQTLRTSVPEQHQSQDIEININEAHEELDRHQELQKIKEANQSREMVIAGTPNKTDEEKKQLQNEPEWVNEAIYANVASALSFDERSLTLMSASKKRQDIPYNNYITIKNTFNNNQVKNKVILNSSTKNFPTTINSINSKETVTPNAATPTAEPYYQIPKPSEPYYDSPKNLRPIPVYENIEILNFGLNQSSLLGNCSGQELKPPKEKPPPLPMEVSSQTRPITDNVYHKNGFDPSIDPWSADTILDLIEHPRNAAPILPAIKRSNLSNHIKDIAGDLNRSYPDLTLVSSPEKAQVLQEKQLQIKAFLCDSPDTGESRDSGVSENHSRQSSEQYTNSSEDNETQLNTLPYRVPASQITYQNKIQLNVSTGTPTSLLQTVQGNSAESWTQSATAAAAATQSLSEATATANAKMLSIEEKIREQGEVLRVECKLLQISQEELKRQRENLLLRENLALRELQHGAKILMSKNRRSLQENKNCILGDGTFSALEPSPDINLQLQQSQPSQLNLDQQIYVNLLQVQQQHDKYNQQHSQYYKQIGKDYRKSMSDLNEFSKCLMISATPPTKPLRAVHSVANDLENEYSRPSQSLYLKGKTYDGSLVTMAKDLSNYINPLTFVRQCDSLLTLNAEQRQQYKRYTDECNPALLPVCHQKRQSMPVFNQVFDNVSSSFNYDNGSNHRLLQKAEQRCLLERTDKQRRSLSMTNDALDSKPLPDSIIQTLTERVQSKGIGERKRSLRDQKSAQATSSNIGQCSGKSSNERVLSVSGKKKCSHCGEELGRGAAMIIESLLLFYHIKCFQCSVCHAQLGDGLNGTDVRVRNHRLHCQNCYSSDDGVKFSCV